MGTFLISVLASLAALLIGLAAGQVLESARRRRRLGYLHSLLSTKKAELVVPSVEFRSFRIEGYAALHRNPRNVLFMPMAEGGAIARLVMTLKAARAQTPIHFETPITTSLKSPLVICVGGPSVNLASKEILAQHFPEFKIAYPQAQSAAYGSTTFHVSRNDQGEVSGDYGFIFVTRRAHAQTVIVLCGILAFGTEIATKCFTTLNPRSDGARLVQGTGTGVLVAQGDVRGLETANVRLIEVRALP